MKNSLPILVLSCLVLLACKKEDPIPEEPVMHQDNIAPCTLVEKSYLTDSIFNEVETNIPGAKFSVKFSDTTTGADADYIRFIFNKSPTTGTYHMVRDIDTSSTALENQISFIRVMYGDFYCSFGTEEALVYVENNSEELIISYCELPYQYYNYDPTLGCHVGNGEGNLMYKKVY